MDLQIQRLTIPSNRRILIVSDIHGRPEWLRRLLEQSGFSARDELFILGDLIEKGPDSLGALRYARELSHQENVHILMGNCDTAWVDVLTDQDCNTLPYMLYRPDSILNEMCRCLGLSVTADSDYPALRSRMRDAFGEELSWLAALPHLIDTPQFLFAHGGITTSVDALEGNTAWGVMKSDFFYNRCVEEGRAFPKYLIVGHMPTPNYCRSIGNCSPLLDRERRILNIDGGTIRPGGQLNLLIVPPEERERFSFLSTDDLPEAIATGTQEPSADPIHLIWTDPFRILKEEGEFCLIHARDRDLRILKKEIIFYPNGELHCTECTDYRLPLQPGDRVKIICSPEGPDACCKKDGCIGWVSKSLLKGCAPRQAEIKSAADALSL